MKIGQTFSSEKIGASLKVKTSEAIDTILQIYNKKIVGRAQTNHPYNNQTYRLTHTTYAAYINKEKTLDIFAPAKSPFTGELYGKKVATHYDENWLKTAANFYKEDIKKDFLKEVTK